MEGRALGHLRWMVGALTACCLIPEEEKLFEKNFLDHSEDGRRTGTRTAMPAACCLIPEELSRPFCGGGALGRALPCLLGGTCIGMPTMS